MQSLARGAVAELGVQWNFSAQRVLDSPTVASPLPDGVKFIVVLVDRIWLSVLPIVLVGVPALKLMTFLHVDGMSRSG